MAFDEKGSVREETYLDADGRPAARQGGVARAAFQRDARGNVTEQSYFGLDGKPVLNASGFARLTTRYDERGRWVEERCFGTDGQPTVNRRGFARVTAEYDAGGNLVARHYFGLDGGPVEVRVVVLSLVPGGQGARLGLRPGDVLDTYDGKAVRTTAGFIQTRQAESPKGPPRRLVLLRQGARLTVQVSPGLLGAALGEAVPGAPAPARPKE